MKKLYTLILINSLFINAYAQNFQWAKVEGAYAYDYGYGIVNDNSGNVYVAGKYEEFANFSGIILPNQGNHDIFLAKYSSAGTINWVTTGGGPLGDYAHALAYDGSNSLYVAGEIEGTNSIISFENSPITLTTLADNDIFLAKYDLTGALVWAVSAGGYYSDKALGVTTDPSGNVYVCGFFTDTATFGGTTTLYGNVGDREIFIAKYDMNGVFQWVRQAGGPGRDEAKEIKCDAAGNVYICGQYQDAAVFGANTLTTPLIGGYHYSNAFLAKYDPTGALQWVKSSGGDYDDVGWSLALDNAGKIYMTGEFIGYDIFGNNVTATSNGNSDAFVACYNSNGGVLWAVNAGGTYLDRSRGIGTDGTNLYITGQFGGTASFGSHTVTAVDSSDVFMAELNSSGMFLWASSVGGIHDSVETLGYESGNAICAQPSGDVYATGALLQGGMFGSVTLPQYSRTDMFITKLSATPVNVLESNNLTDVRIYPNPSTGNLVLHVKDAKNGKMEMTIYNGLAQVVNKKTGTFSSDTNIDLSSQQKGIYLIELKEGEKVYREKIILQ